MKVGEREVPVRVAVGDRIGVDEPKFAQQVIESEKSARVCFCYVRCGDLCEARVDARITARVCEVKVGGLGDLAGVGDKYVFG